MIGDCLSRGVVHVRRGTVAGAAGLLEAVLPRQQQDSQPAVHHVITRIALKEDGHASSSVTNLPRGRHRLEICGAVSGTQVPDSVVRRSEVAESRKIPENWLLESAPRRSRSQRIILRARLRADWCDCRTERCFRRERVTHQVCRRVGHQQVRPAPLHCAASYASAFTVDESALRFSSTHSFFSHISHLRFSCCKAPEREALSSAIPGYTGLLSRLCRFSCHTFAVMTRECSWLLVCRFVAGESMCATRARRPGVVIKHHHVRSNQSP